MQSRGRWTLLTAAALTMSLWLAGCEPQREEVIEDVDIEQADPDTPPPIVEPIRNDEDRTRDDEDRDDPTRPDDDEPAREPTTAPRD